MAIVINKPLPEFEAVATEGVQVTNISHIGQMLVLYFYPKDDTPGCTAEASHFRDQHEEFVKAGATVFGVCRDNMKSHDAFKAKLQLPFELIADTEEKMCHMFGVVKNKLMYGRKVKAIDRSTFLINAEGVLVHEWRGVRVKDDDRSHVDEVLAAVRKLGGYKEEPAQKAEKTTPAAKKTKAEKTVKATAETPEKPAKAEKPATAKKAVKTIKTATAEKVEKKSTAAKDKKADSAEKKPVKTAKAPSKAAATPSKSATKTEKTPKTAVRSKSEKAEKPAKAEKTAKTAKAASTAAPAKKTASKSKAAPSAKA